MKKKVAYIEPDDYFPEEIRREYKLGEYADTDDGSEGEGYIENCGGIQPIEPMPPIFGEDGKMGVVVGAIFGDIVGSAYEFNNIKTKGFELFSKKSMFTDDTVMTLAVASAIVKYDKATSRPNRPTNAQCIHDVELFKKILISEMHRLGEKYPNVGYGGMFESWILEKRETPYGSYGNGAAMRVSPVAWYANTLEEAMNLAGACAEVTHDHHEGIKGAAVTAGAVHLARRGDSREEIKRFVSNFYDLNFTLDEIRPTYKFNETCQETVPQAMQAFFESVSFEDAIRNAVSIGGDSDTLAAITGSVAEAFYGTSAEQKKAVMSRLTPDLSDIAVSFYKLIAK